MLSTDKNLLRLVVASKNPVKINAAKEAFELSSDLSIAIEAVDVASGVAAQPMTYDETHLGAETRVDNAIALSEKKGIDADYFIAYEGGVDVFEDGPKTFAIVCISDGQTKIFGQSATLPIPMCIYNELLNNIELGSAMDSLFNTVNIKQKGGAIGQLTKGLETRMSVYKSATVLTLSRFTHSSLFD